MSVTEVDRIVAAGLHCGIKPSGAPDLAIVAVTGDRPAIAAGVFTTNRFAAAPVLVSRDHLLRSEGRGRAVLINSGNANAGTGEQGVRDARRTCEAVADALGCDPVEVLVCSTGIIGRPLEVDRIVAAVPELVRRADSQGAEAAARAIMTTDTKPKTSTRRSGGTTVAGIAKGAAMLSPSMATMLAVITTDAAVDAQTLTAELHRAVEQSFHRITVDGCRSTNDTVLVLATGDRGCAVDDLRHALCSVCSDLAEQMVRDAEGATKFVTVAVHGAASDAEALTAARRIAESLLVKCSLYGEDPYWGRVASEVGAAGVAMNPDTLRISYGGTVVADGGISVPHDAEAVARHMAGREVELVVDLGLGDGSATVLTSDLTHGYVDENKGTS
ncbi:MAG: arginine biosynthesis bifunctional protein ArgJ [Acidimicrobiales bacterium]|nr:MAG: arginine biosynthesis bifunctional protein ArgJ [Acidimicrobiales bacterium]